MQACGLKLNYAYALISDITSRLMQACGLKLDKRLSFLDILLSRLMQACGLKPSHKFNCHKFLQVTPHAGVWIETEVVLHRFQAIFRHASCRRVD